MNMDLFRELNRLINEKQETESFLEQLKGKKLFKFNNFMQRNL